MYKVPLFIYYAVLGYPISYPGHDCGIIDGSVRYSWQNAKCDKKLSYICYSNGVLPSPTEGI